VFRGRTGETVVINKIVMNPTRYMFDAPVPIPLYDTSAKCICFLGVSENDGKAALEWRPLHDWPRMRHRTTGQHARIVKALADDIRQLPKFGKVALQFEELLVVGPFPVREWIVDDWIPVLD
jgi:hypothetical protein